MNGRMDGFVPPKLDINVQSGVLPDDNKLCIDFNQTSVQNHKGTVKKKKSSSFSSLSALRLLIAETVVKE